ncbi:F-box only protein 10-like [Mya arenaria]|uniref:F-box only protein 10-like n=1 Tax=Mya arenaria TaxID=6604 RepID=UPI0022E0BC59|nr:F-box only protein 10-like [Mya arenaria]
MQAMDRVDRETVSSAVTVKTDTGSKVLPGDKRGLPYEIWAIILSYLGVEDLSRSAMVCKTWNEVVLSMDHTKWKELYLLSTDWKHPYWPLNLHSEPISWREAYKHQYIATNFWTQIDRRPGNVTCMSVFKKTKARKTITVGVGKDFESLKAALAVANDYDRIMVYPGIYDEQFEMSSKIPFELIGVGELGSVILVVCIEQTAITGRISNLVFRAPWFTNFILKVRSGYLQVDNCILEDGMMYVQNPGTVTLSFCTFRHATIILQHVNASIIQNCMFSQTDTAAITLEGYPKDDRNWTFRALNAKITNTCSLQKKPEQPRLGEGLIPKSAFSLSTATTSHKKSVSKSHLLRQSSVDTEALQRKMSHDMNVSFNANVEGAVGGVNIRPLDRRRQSACDSTFSRHTLERLSNGDEEDDLGHLGTKSHTHMTAVKHKAHSLTTHELTEQNVHAHDSRHHKEKIKRIENFVSDCAKYSNAGTSEGGSTVGDENSDDLHPNGNHDNDLHHQGHHHHQQHHHHQHHHHHQNHHPSQGQGHGHLSHQMPNTQLTTPQRKTLYDSQESDCESDIMNPKGLEKVPALDLHSLTSPNRQDGSQGNRGHGGSSGVGLDQGLRLAPRERSISSSEVSIHTASSNDVSEEDEGGGYDSDGDQTSSSSDEDSLPFSDRDSQFSSSEESVIMLTYPDRHQPRSVSAQGDLNDVASINSQNQSEHIDIIQDNDMRRMLNEVRGCLIYKCRVTQSKGAVMVSLQAHGIIMECEINCVGYGIRCIQNSTTVVLKNEIHHCRTSAVFMRLAATGLITGNDIHSNGEAGVDIRKNADPIVQCNRIHHGKRSGVVVLGSGRGQIRHNDIYQNKEAGVYILYRGNPTICNNQIYSGKAAGIAINEGGRGYIYGNTITGNQWGGIDIRHGGDPIVHQNTVCNGVSDGVVIGEGGRGIIQNNIITGNAGCGVWMMSAQQPLIHGNEVHSNRDTGICLVNKIDSSHKVEAPIAESKDTPSQTSLDFWGVVQDDPAPAKRPITMATLEYNKVFNNLGQGISLQFGEPVTVDSNLVHGNHGNGIHVDQAFPATLTNNCVTCNTGSGVMAKGQGKVCIRGNGIYDNRDHGVWCQCDAEVTENDILGNRWSAVHLKLAHQAKVQNNRLHAADDFLICLTGIRHCEMEGNLFYGPKDRSVSADEASHCTSMANQVLPTPQSNNDISRRCDPPDMTPLGKTRWQLIDPAPRPHLLPPPAISHAHQGQTIITRLTIPAENCDHGGSKLCIIL